MTLPLLTRRHVLALLPALPLGPLALKAAEAGQTLQLHVDASDIDRRVFQVRQTLPVQPGPLALQLPRWIPGHHAPTGDIARIAGLMVHAGAQRLDWQRDPLDTHVFHVELPPGARELQIAFQYLGPLSDKGARISITRDLLSVAWNEVVLYPAGAAAAALPVQAVLKLPAGWQHASALRAERGTPDGIVFQPVSLDTLIDSPVFAGRHAARFELDAPGAPRPVVLHVFADRPEQLKAEPAQIDAHRALVAQADKLFGSRPFAHYDFLLGLSEEFGWVGLEHHQSSENVVEPDYFEDWEASIGERELLPHEYVHAWNGKYRRPAGLATPHFNAPMHNELLWVYEGQTQYWGKVLAARSGLVTAEQARDGLASVAGYLEQRRGRRWRSLQDTTSGPIVSAEGGAGDWHDWQRGYDYYDEAALVWLEADMLIREASAGRRSLDDFARRFFNGPDGDPGPRPYGFDDVVQALNAVQPHDWVGLLRARLGGHGPGAPLDGLRRAGWQLAWADTPGEAWKAWEASEEVADLGPSLGLSVTHEGRVRDVLWDSPAFRAGLRGGLTLVAVNQRAFKPERLQQALRDNTGGQQPIDLLVRDGEHFRHVRIDYRDGLRYPRLDRIEGQPDRLATLFAPR